MRLEAEDVTVRYGQRIALDHVSAAIGAGEIVGLIGPNGAGKSTLIRVMARVLSPSSGRVTLDGDAASPSFARTVAYLPQAAPVHWPVNVRTLVALGRLPHTGPFRGEAEADRAAVRRALDACDLGDLADRPVTELSGGERSRVLLARALATEPAILLADEPAAGLDPSHQLDLMDQLRRLAGAGAGIALVSHDLTFAGRFCDRLVLLHEGRVAADGTPDTVLTDQLLARCYSVRVQRGALEDGHYIIPISRAEPD